MRATRLASLLVVTPAIWAGVVLDGAGESDAAEAPAAAGLPATVSFVDPRPLSIGFAELRRHGGLSVSLHNDLDRTQGLRLRLVGSGGTDAGALFASRATRTRGVGAGQTVSLGFRLRYGQVAGEEDYEALLVASGQSGGLVRRALTITVPSPLAADPPAALRPGEPVDITLTAVNYTPSPLSDLLPFLFLLVAALIAAGIVSRLLNTKRRALPRLLVSAGVLVAMIGIGVHLSGWENPGVRKIVPRAITVSAAVEQGVRGSVAGGGEVAGLVVSRETPGAPGKLEPQALNSAASYKGTYDLAPGDEGGGAKATVDVRDFWPYALLAICLGIYVGYRLRHWYQVERPRKLLEARLQELREDYAEGLRVHAAQDRNCPYAMLTIEQRFGTRERRIEDALRQGELAEAGTQIESLRTYIEAFLALRVELENLDNLWRRLQLTRERLSDPATGERSPDEVLSRAPEAHDVETVLSSPIDGPDPDVGGVKLEERRTDVSNLAKRIGAIVEELKARVARVDAGAPSEGGEPAQAILYGRKRVGRGMETGEPIETGEPTIEIRWRLDDESEPETGTVYVDKQIWFEISVTPGNQPPFPSIEIDFGDGERLTRNLPVDSQQDTVNIEISHCYRSGGTMKAIVRPGSVAGPTDETTVVVNPRIPAAKLHAQIAEKDRAASYAAFALAAGSGMTALYFTNAAWGQPADYLAALLWGGVTAEGIKMTSALIKRELPGA